MRRALILALAAALPLGGLAAPTWQIISSEQGKRIELDRTSIKREEGGKVLAVGRVTLEKEILDIRSGSGYRIIEATTRYDCASRNAVTVKRVFKKSENEVIREEEQKGSELPVRSGTLDDKVLREVCRPGKTDIKEVAQKANEAAGQLKQANEALVKKELAKPEKAAKPVATKVEAEHAPLKEAARPAPAAKEAPPPAPTPSAVVAKLQPQVRKPLEAAAPAHATAEHLHWAYEGPGGPENWHRLDPRNTLCATGQRQSPIDIRDGIKVDLEPIRFDYRPSAFRIVDNGHTVQVALDAGSLTVTGKTYEFVQFHFHKPSEEKINGQGFDMVAHLVHRADDGKLAVVAVLLERGAENPFIQTLWNNLPLERQQEVRVAASLDLNALLPANRNYFTYMGSLTTPPCSEGVLWLVMKQPVAVSPDQIAVFSRLYPRNARPIQPVAGRLIKEGR